MRIFSRKMILGERVMYADGMSPVNCVFTVCLRGDVSSERLRHALNRVQVKHPLLRARIVSRMGRPYFKGDEAVPEIPVGVIERVTGQEWKQVTEEQWALAFDADKGPLARVVWFKGEGMSELMLVCPHCICDGATGVTLMKEILLLLDRPDGSVGEYSMFQNIKEIVPPALRGGMIRGYLKSLGIRLLFSLRPVKKKSVRGSDYSIRWRWEEEGSRIFIERCKQEGVTVHAAFCVALLEAYGEVMKEKAKNKVICPVDIRRYVREIRKDMMFAFAPIVELGIAGVAGGGAGDLWEKCRRLKDDLSEKMERVKAYELLIQSELYHPVGRKLIRWLCVDAGSHDLTFSNMGRMDIPEEYGSFGVDAVYSPTVAFPWCNPTTLVVSSFRGEMDFAYVSNSGYLRYEEAMAIKERAMQVVQLSLSEDRLVSLTL